MDKDARHALAERIEEISGSDGVDEEFEDVEDAMRSESDKDKSCSEIRVSAIEDVLDAFEDASCLPAHEDRDDEAREAGDSWADGQTNIYTADLWNWAKENTYLVEETLREYGADVLKDNGLERVFAMAQCRALEAFASKVWECAKAIAEEDEESEEEAGAVP